MSNSHKQIIEKKKELEANLARLQQGLDRSIDEVKEDVADTLSPKQVIRKYPLPVVGASIVLGFLLGSSGKRSSSNSVGKRTSDDDLMHSIGHSLKKRLAQKAIDAALDFVETQLSNPKPPSQNS